MYVLQYSRGIMTADRAHAREIDDETLSCHQTGRLLCRYLPLLLRFCGEQNIPILLGLERKCAKRYNLGYVLLPPHSTPRHTAPHPPHETTINIHACMRTGTTHTLTPSTAINIPYLHTVNPNAYSITLTHRHLYSYPSQILFSVSIPGVFFVCNVLNALGNRSWKKEGELYLVPSWFATVGMCLILLACLLEGKPIPTFPTCLCRPRRQPGLQFTAALGGALAHLAKYGLETQHQKDFPAEAEMESLLSTSPLMVASTPDMDLMGCIEYLVARCTDDQGEIAKRYLEMPIGRLLREGCNQHTVKTAQIPALRHKATKSLEVRLNVVEAVLKEFKTYIFSPLISPSISSSP